MTRLNSFRRKYWAVLPLVAILAGCGAKADKDTFELSITPASTGPAARGRQILVPQPTALSSLDSDQVIVRVSPSEIQYLAKSQWGDRLPRMVQAKLVEAFENSGRLGGVGTPGQGLAIDYQVVTDIRTFEVDISGVDMAAIDPGFRAQRQAVGHRLPVGAGAGCVHRRGPCAVMGRWYRRDRDHHAARRCLR